MLRLIRRHVKTCPHTSSRYRRCNCPIHVYGTLGGEKKIRKALDLTSWEAASELVQGWTASGEVGVLKTEIPDLKDAVDKFLHDLEHGQQRKTATLQKHNEAYRDRRRVN